MQMLKQLLIGVTVAFSVTTAMAAEPPQEVIQKATNAMIQRLSADRELIKSNPAHVESIVQDVVLPEVDTASVARRVLGAHARTASGAQLERFTLEFQSYLVRFYARAFANYDGEEIAINGEPEWDARGNAIVKTDILRRNGQKIPVWYRMSPNGSSWKMYDVVVEGISLVQSKKEEFSPLINSKGLDGVIAELAQVNAGNKP